MATQGQALERESRDESSREAPRPPAIGRESSRASGARNGNGSAAGALQNVNPERLAYGLGWFSIGLGLAELLTPRGVAKIAGLPGRHTGFIRLMGLREIAHGIAIFAQGRRPAAAVWSRVAGDALDLAALGVAFASPDSNKGGVAFATANVLTITALDVLCAQMLTGGEGAQKGGGTPVRNSIIVNRPPEELYQFWRDFENLPRIMYGLQSVRVTGEGRSHWVAKAPAGTTVEWDAEVTEDRPNELIAWRSLPGADVDNSGSVRFETAPGNRGTIVRVEMEYNPPGGALGAAVATLFGREPGQQAQEALRCFKQVVETGEVIVSDGTFWDNGLLTQRPAQPVSGEELGAARGGGAA